MSARLNYPPSPYWHINFANKERLPNLQLNQKRKLRGYVVFIAACLLAGFYGYTLARETLLNSKIKRLRDTVQNRSKINDDHLKLSREFTKRVSYLETLQTFTESTFDPVPSLVALAKIRPENLFISTLSFNAEDANKLSAEKAVKKAPHYQLNIKGNILGSYAQALSTTTKFSQTLAQADYFKSKLVSYELKELVKANETETDFRYLILITLKGA